MWACSIDARSSLSSREWASVGSPGPKFVAGIPDAAKNETSVQPSLARGGLPVDVTSDASSGWSSDGGATWDRQRVVAAKKIPFDIAVPAESFRGALVYPSCAADRSAPFAWMSAST